MDVGCTPSQAALCWMQYHHPEVFLIFGAETPFQVQSNMDFIRLGESVARSFFEELDALDVPQSAKLFNPDLWAEVAMTQSKLFSPVPVNIFPA